MGDSERAAWWQSATTRRVVVLAARLAFGVGVLTFLVLAATPRFYVARPQSCVERASLVVARRLPRHEPARVRVTLPPGCTAEMELTAAQPGVTIARGPSSATATEWTVVPTRLGVVSFVATVAEVRCPRACGRVTPTERTEVVANTVAARAATSLSDALGRASVTLEPAARVRPDRTTRARLVVALPPVGTAEVTDLRLTLPSARIPRDGGETSRPAPRGGGEVVFDALIEAPSEHDVDELVDVVLSGTSRGEPVEAQATFAVTADVDPTLWDRLVGAWLAALLGAILGLIAVGTAVVKAARWARARRRRRRRVSDRSRRRAARG